MAAATSTVALPESNVPPSPLLSLPQEEFLMRDVSVSTGTANDPQPQLIPRPQMIPKMDRK